MGVQQLLAPISLVVTGWLGWLLYKATARAPIDAARVAAELAGEINRKAEIERRRMFVFATLMSARRTTYSKEVVSAFNTIDVFFYDCPDVREAWADLHDAVRDRRLGTESGFRFQEEKLEKLLVEMAKVLGLSRSIGVADVRRSYYPDGLSNRDLLEMLQTEAALRQFSNQSAPNTDRGALEDTRETS
jgi:hypothetical protein